VTGAPRAAFEPEVLDALRDQIEVEIETSSAAHGPRRVIIWSVVVDGVPYVRSYRGLKGRWYQDVVAEPRCAIHVMGRRVPSRAVPALEPDTVQAVSDALAAKYANDSATPDMLVPAVLPTTLRLEPA
jgi:hypothetical protein